MRNAEQTQNPALAGQNRRGMTRYSKSFPRKRESMDSQSTDRVAIGDKIAL